MEEKNEIKTHPETQCYLCGSDGLIQYENVEDRIYDAPGKWNIKKCTNAECGLIWLDPMPDKDEIWKAYKNYYTHQESSNIVFRFLRPFVNPYLSIFYGYFNGLSFLKKLKGLILLIFVTEKVNVDFKVLWLKNRKEKKLLDIGCGNGVFIDDMNDLGWTTTGIDFDGDAVDYCLKKGLNAKKGDLKGLSFPSESFDVITLNHVIEHLYDPAEVLQECFRILKPGGEVVITTPNAQSWMFNFWFKDSWYALQAPAHLHIFNLRNLITLFNNKGFAVLKATTTTRIEGWIYYTSRIIKKEGSFKQGKKYSKVYHIFGRILQLLTMFYLLLDKTKGNEIRISVKKPQTLNL
jgi:2-polyprenyl-3-methyl-5-hydroxy-6-metoxy-1,4-benzoquinol methylase